MPKTIIFTGGGTAGHVTPNIALIKKIQCDAWTANYIGSKNGIEKELISKIDIPYFAISSGKLRRYFSWKNFIDPFKIIYGIVQAFFLCLKIKPKVIFSKGGFVSFPVVVAGWLNKIPVIIHESDLTPGLANKLCFPFASKVCVTFPETAKYFRDKKKVIVTGTPIRAEFFEGIPEIGRKICGFSSAKKIILVYGGSLGAEKINKVVRQLFPNILENFQIAHVCGKGKIAALPQFEKESIYANYKQFEYLGEEFPHVIAAADIIISRSGANSVYELVVLRKPHILIPLGKNFSRGDQIENANHCKKLGYSQVIFENELSAEKLKEKIAFVNDNLEAIAEKLKTFVVRDSVAEIFDLIISYAGQ